MISRFRYRTYRGVSFFMNLFIRYLRGDRPSGILYHTAQTLSSLIRFLSLSENEKHTYLLIDMSSGVLCDLKLTKYQIS